MSRLAAINAYLAGNEVERPPFPLHIVAVAAIAAGVALGIAAVAHFYPLH